jgi:hypothetical protein
MASPTATVLPTSTTISRTPDVSAIYGTVDFSVSISRSSSPTSTWSPVALNQAMIVPSFMESDSFGITM